MAILSDLQKGVNSLVGLNCWGIVGGAGTGTNISFEMGRKIKRKKPLSNPTLTDDLKHFKGEFGFFVECSWRIENITGIVCSSKSSASDIVNGLRKMINEEISAVEIQDPSCDLVLSFANSTVLKIFCDEVDFDEGIDNYTLSTPSHNYIVGCRSEVRIESRE